MAVHLNSCAHDVVGYQCSTPWFVCYVGVRNGIIIAAAPVLKRYIGCNFYRIVREQRLSVYLLETP